MADDSPYPQAPFLVSPLPEKVTATTTHGKDVETPELSDRQNKYFADEAELRKQREATEGQIAEQTKANALITAAGEKEKAAELDREMAERQKAFDQSQGEITEWSTRLRDARDKFDGAKTQSFFRDNDTYGNVLKGIAFSLGAASDAMRARIGVMTGRDQGPSTVDQLIKSDMDRQKDDIKLMSDKVAMARSGLDDANDARKMLLAQVDVKSAMAFKRIQQIAAANLASQGVAQADITKNENIAKWRDDELKAQAASVNGLTQHVTKQGVDQTITQNENKPDTSKASTPTHVADVLTGENLPVDSTGTENRQHNTAIHEVGPINTFLYSMKDMIDLADKTGPSDPTFVTKLIGGDATQGGREGDIKRLRSAYATAKGESIGEGNRKELEAAIPDPPSSMSTKGAWDVWNERVHHTFEEMINLRKQKLAAAGVPLDVVDKASDPRKWGQRPASHGAPPLLARPVETAPPPPAGAKDSPEDVNSSAPLPEDPNADELEAPTKTPRRLPGLAQLKHIDVAAPSAPGPAAAPAPGAAPDMVSDPRARAIAKLKANPNLPGRSAVMAAFGITPEDLR